MVKAVVFSRDGREVTKNDWSNASPSMESSIKKIEVKNKNKSSARPEVLKEAQTLNLFVKAMQ